MTTAAGVVCAGLLIGSLAHATLPPWAPDRVALREYCTRGRVDGQQVCEPLMKPAVFSSKDPSSSSSTAAARPAPGMSRLCASGQRLSSSRMRVTLRMGRSTCGQMALRGRPA